MDGLPKAWLQILPGHTQGPIYDVDYFGHDDGSSRDPNDSFRLILQLGVGYFIYLYVVGMGQPDGLGRFTSFWLKDCAVVDVEMEEFGEQDLVVSVRRDDQVKAPIEVPVNFAAVTLWRGDQQTARYAVTGCAFEAMTDLPAKPVLTMRWRLGDDGLLTWTSTSGWSISVGGTERLLVAGEYVTFVEPAHIVR